jgi:hypothetical protein
VTQKTLLRTLLLLLALGVMAAGCSQATPAPQAAAETYSSAEPVLTFTGQVENPLSLSRADLEGMGVVEKAIEHPKDGVQMVTGILLSTLLEGAEPSRDATLTFTASDAYSVDVPVGDAEVCTDCMVAFDGDTLRLIMPGFGSSFWVKEVVSIEAK